MTDALGDRMKEYEMMEAGRRLMPRLPAIARLDGRSFSRYTRGMGRPYDPRLSALMAATARHLAVETNARAAYTQSDEITLAWYATGPTETIFFDGRIQKMTSVLAATAAAYFNEHYVDAFGAPHPDLATFDCRVFNVPDIHEGANVFLWREWDATKNSISMAARAHFSHAEVQNKNGAEMQEMLFSLRGVNWNDYPPYFKRGKYVRRVTRTRTFSPDELAALPEKHAARADPGLVVERSDYEVVDMPPLSKVVNRAGVLFLGEDPVTAAD